MSSKPTSWHPLTASLWSPSFGPLFGSTSTSSENHRMDTYADDQEIQRNCQVEAKLALMGNLTDSDPTCGSFTNEENFYSLTPEIVQSLYSEDASIQLKATQRVRQLISNMLFESIHQVIKSGAVPRFVHFLEDTRYPELQFESAWVLSDISLGTSAQTQVVIDAGAIPVLIRLLSSPNEKIIQLSLQTLGNIIFDSASRDLVLNSSVLQPLLGIFSNDTLSRSTVRTATWALRILCWGENPRVHFETVSPSLPVLSRLIRNCQDATVLANACWALSSLCEGPIEQIQVVLESGVCPRAIQLLTHTSNQVVLGALDLVGKIALGTDAQAQVLIHANACPALGSLLSHEKGYIVKEACRTLSSITSRNEAQLEASIHLISSLIGRLHHRDASVRKSAAWAIAKATASASNEQIGCIVEAGAIPPLCKLLSETDSYLTKFSLSGLVNILRSGESMASQASSTVNAYATLICNSPWMKLALFSSNTTSQLEATQRFGKLLGTPEGLTLLIDEVIRSGAVRRFVHLLEDTRYPELQFESAWVLTHLASGNPAQTQVVLDSGVVPVLIRRLSSSEERVVEQSVWAIGNIARNSTEYRDLLLNSNVLPPLLGLFNGSNLSTSLMRTATWTLSALCAGKYSPPNFAQVSPCLPLLARLMVKKDEDILVNVCQALSSLCDDSNEQIQVVIESGLVCPRAVQLLSHPSNEVVSVALGFICAISGGTHSQAQRLIQANVLPALGSLLYHEKESIVTNACRTLANLTAENGRHIQALIDASLLPSLIGLLGHGDLQIGQQAAKSIRNATANASKAQIECIVKAGAIPSLCNLPTERGTCFIKIALACLEKILLAGEAVARAAGSAENVYATLVRQCGGFEKLVFLSSDSNLKIKSKVLSLLEMLSGSE